MIRLFVMISMLLGISYASAQSLSDTEKIALVRFSSNPAALLVEKHLMDSFPEYSDSPPSHTVGLIDLNGDESFEIIVRIDHEYNFCDEEYWCDTRVFVYQGTNLIEVAQFNSGGDIRATKDTTENIRNLLVGRKDGKYDLYAWSDDSYVKVTK